MISDAADLRADTFGTKSCFMQCKTLMLVSLDDLVSTLPPPPGFRVKGQLSG